MTAETLTMPRTRAFPSAALIPLAALAAPAAASEPPKELYGKSVVVTWNEERVQRREDQREFRTVTIRGEYSVYVSSEGRLFNRVTMENPRGQKGGRTASATRNGASPSSTATR